MDPSSITPIIVGVLSALVPALYTYLRGENRRARAQARILAAEHDERDERLMRHRAMIRLHNDKWHPTGENAMPLPELPERMKRDEDDA